MKNKVSKDFFWTDTELPEETIPALYWLNIFGFIFELAIFGYVAASEERVPFEYNWAYFGFIIVYQLHNVAILLDRSNTVLRLSFYYLWFFRTANINVVAIYIFFTY